MHTCRRSCTHTKSSVRHKMLSNCNAILVVFYQYLTILSTINKEIRRIIILTVNDNRLSYRFSYHKQNKN